MKAVRLENVSFSYNESIHVLDSVNFYANYGDVTLLAGHSGEGKSTLLSIISGIIPNINYGKLSGDVIVDGQSIRSLKLSDICRKVGVVLQNADEQIVHKLVGDEIAFGCENLAFPPDKIQKQIDVVCKLLSLDEHARTRTLSGGQKQKLIAASTLAMGQRIIILDEPLANLDSKSAEQLMTTLRALAKSGYCVIVIEHRLDIILPFIDETWHIENKSVTRVLDKEKYLKEQSVVIKDTLEPYNQKSTLLKLENLVFNIKEKAIIDSITCDIPKGARTVLLGENGSGKTTLIRLIARLAKQTSGTITQYIGAKFKQGNRAGKAWFKKVGVVYQNPDYQLFMKTVRGEIEFGAVTKEYAEHILNLFGLSELADRHPQSLSAGQKRRVSIAAVAACKPELLLLDEPTVGQDYEGLCKLVEILNNLHKELGNTMITITHDMRCGEALCDKAIVMKAGKVIAEGGKELVENYFSSHKHLDKTNT